MLLVAILEVFCDRVVLKVPMLVSMESMLVVLVSTLLDSVSTSPSKLLRSVFNVETVLDNVVMLA